MNYLTSARHSTLEIFPDELFLELFSFIQPVDLYRAFRHLNQRLTRILHDIYICMHITSDDDDELQHECLNYFSRQIIYLAVDCHPTRLLYEIDLRPFNNLRSLHLPLPTDEQCSQITPQNFPFLTQLTIHNNAYRSIVFGSNSFPYLIACCIPQIYPDYERTMRPCVTLRSLQLGSCSLQYLLRILPHAPNLTYLDVCLQSSEAQITETDWKHEKLSHLKIKIRKLVPDFEIILKTVPNLSRLEFLWNESCVDRYSRKSFDFTLFSSLLRASLSPLFKHLDIDIHVPKCDENIGDIHEINPAWFSRLSKINIISHDYSVFLTTRKLVTNADNALTTILLQSTYITRRNARFNRIKLDKTPK
ncbi:unnamed protein product [Adineta ricciae]|uniref:F-box domain-containing protein n=2 Tax=Adineta ricciae TaxID=249248 RepID=A0A815QL05_ADIRI|nr:unnamed protein product [Adineta ricciae]CAF1464836.1 unnamed protein product [Adineta ricciae]